MSVAHLRSGIDLLSLKPNRPSPSRADGQGRIPGTPHCSRPLVPAFAKQILAVTLGAAVLSGCVGSRPPQNLGGEFYGPEKATPSKHRTSKRLTYSDNTCPAAGTPKFIMPASNGRRYRHRLRLPPMRYSKGDRFSILIVDSPEFSGDYAINADGRVILPFAGQIPAAGLTNAQLERRIRRTLIRKGIFSRHASRVSVRPIQYAPVNITVAGAVFSPGRHTINVTKEREKLNQVLTKSGDSPLDRFLPAGLQAAGGVRPDADLSDIKVVRNGRTFRLNWRGAITGQPVDDLPLIDGDHVQVGETGCFQSALVRPTQITPQGVRIYVSNLTGPSRSSGAASAAAAANKGGVPYGTRLLQGLVQATCVGGSYATNARRYAVLISRNPKTGKTEVIQRSIEKLVRSANRDAINPFLMPDDAIACYDSAVTEFRDVMSTLWLAVAPVRSISKL
jgi:polysaccharide biosynthesis/export protein